LVDPQGSETDKAAGVKIISEVINFLRETYIGWLAKESKFAKRNIQTAVAEAESKQKTKSQTSSLDYYNWPKGTPEEKKEEYRRMKERYGFFMSNGRIWKDIEGLAATSISNFEIEIIQHMNDDKFPKKLVRIKNVTGKEAVFDTDSQNFNSLLSFKNAITAFGNFKFKGNNNDLDMLTDYLFDEMGVGRKIDVMGWQTDANCWVWNNGITIPTKGTQEIDENGVFRLEDTTYYVPSANSIYKNSTWQYQSQKKFILKGGDVSLPQYVKLMREVHREHAISGSLFALASIFQDIITDKFHFFPILFLYGPASSGKSQLALACQSFFGLPQAQVNLGQQLSTGKSMIREFAQFANSTCILNEYKPALPGIDDMIKGLWDRQGYKRGNLDSKVSNEEVPILSSTIMTGNYYPTNEIVISRIIAEEMTKDNFTLEDKKKFEEMEDVLKFGISRITQEVIHQRPTFEESFAKEFRLAKEYISKSPNLAGLQERYFQNAAVLAATYEILSKNFAFPFSKLEMMNHFENTLLAQKVKVQYSSTVSRFWDIFLFAIRGSESLKLKPHVDYKLDGSILFFNHTHVYNRVQTEWWPRFHEPSPSKMSLKADLKESNSYAGSKSSEPMAPGRDAVNTSVDMYDLKKLDNYEEMISAIQMQLNSQLSLEIDSETDNSSSSPMTGKLPF